MTQRWDLDVRLPPGQVDWDAAEAGRYRLPPWRKGDLVHLTVDYVPVERLALALRGLADAVEHGLASETAFYTALDEGRYEDALLMTGGAL